MLVVIDLGNTRVKFAAFDGDRLVATEAVHGGPTIAGDVIPFPYVTTGDEIVVGASSPDRLEMLLNALERPARVLGAEVVAAVPTTYERAEELGIDRLAAAYGARAIVGGGAVVAVDAGTATTVDAIDADGRFVALAIAPGLESATAGLGSSAPHLPAVALARSDSARREGRAGGAAPDLPARSTAASLRNGFGLGLAGAIDRLVTEARGLVGESAPVVLTGGAAPALMRHLRSEVLHAPDCVLHGLAALHRAVPA
jgi:type III pantothenate kinase